MVSWCNRQHYESIGRVSSFSCVWLGGQKCQQRVLSLTCCQCSHVNTQLPLYWTFWKLSTDICMDICKGHAHTCYSHLWCCSTNAVNMLSICQEQSTWHNQPLLQYYKWKWIRNWLPGSNSSSLLSKSWRMPRRCAKNSKTNFYMLNTSSCHGYIVVCNLM